MAPACGPSRSTHGPPLEPFHKEALTPKTGLVASARARSSVPGQKLLNPGFATVSRSRG
jgi:hypothetical protein